MPAELRAFIEQYRAAFDRLDGEAVAALYAVPSGMVDDDGQQHWTSFEAIRHNMVALCQLYRDHGYAGATYRPVAFLAQGDRFAVVDIAWCIERSGGQTPWHFNTLYNLLRTAAGWRVLLCTAYSEKKLND